MLAFITNLPATIPAFAVVAVFAVALWYVLNVITRFDDHNELFERGNWAYFAQRISLLGAYGIAMLAVIPDFDTANPLGSTGWLAAEGLYVFLAILGSRFVVDAALFPKIKNDRLLLERNAAVGIAEAGFYVGIGFLLNGSLTGTAGSVLASIVSTVGFYVLGLAFVVVVFYLYELATRYSLRAHIAQGEVASALEVAGVLIAGSIVTSVGVAGDYTTLGESLGWFFITAFVSIVVLLVVWLVSSALILRSVTSVRNAKQPVASAMQAGIMILASIIVATVIGSVA